MSQKIRLAEARDSLAFVCDGGMCADDVRVIDRINEAEELLMQKAGWQGTQKIVRMCVNGCCLSLPREIKRVIKARIGNSFANVMSHWYQFLEGGLGDISQDDSGWIDLWDILESPTRFDLPEPAKLMVLSDQDEDREVRMLIRGWDEKGKEIFDDGHPGEYVLVNGTVGVYTKNKFSGIMSVCKPVTTGYIYMYAIDITDGDTVFLSSYHPDETNPSYRRYQIKQNVDGTTVDQFDRTRNTYRYQEILALVKFQHIKLTHPSDTLYIESLPAMKSMLQAMRFYDTNEITKGEACEARAEKILLEQLSDFTAEESTIEMRDPFAAGSVEDVL